MRRPARTSGSSSTTTSRTAPSPCARSPVTCAHGSHARTAKPPLGVGAVARACRRRGPPARPAPAGPSPDAGSRRRRRRADRQPVAHLDRRGRRPACPAMSHRHGRARARACARWSAPPARSGTPCGPSGRPATSSRPVVDSATRIPPARDSATSAGDVAEGGLRRSGPASAGCGRVAQHPEHRRAAPSAPGARCPGSTSRPRPAPRRRQVGAVAEGPGVHRHQRDPVRQHVVHLAGDPGALGRPGLGHARHAARARRVGARSRRSRRARAGSPCT